jgi:hypothetical protein
MLSLSHVWKTKDLELPAWRNSIFLSNENLSLLPVTSSSDNICTCGGLADVDNAPAVFTYTEYPVSMINAVINSTFFRNMVRAGPIERASMAYAGIKYLLPNAHPPQGSPHIEYKKYVCNGNAGDENCRVLILTVHMV